jgi:5'-deoxynucleotidase YfbR-like HD superfamily hydrolase
MNLIIAEPHIPSEFEIETFSGQFVDTKKPDPATIRLEDIAHALGNICRFGGHSKRFYSVAQHAVFVCERVKRRGYGTRAQFAALHHDDAEAFLGDIPRPLKPLLGKKYKDLSDRMDRAIITALDLPVTVEDLHDARVKSADNWSLFVEADDLLPSKGKQWWDGAQGATKWGLEPLPERLVIPDYFIPYTLSPDNATQMYLRYHRKLTEGD